MNAIADDYENVDQVILPRVAKDCAKLGFAIERSEIVKALGELVAGGLAKAFLLSSKEASVELKGMPSLDLVEEDFTTYFYVTKNVTDAQLLTTHGGPSMTMASRCQTGIFTNGRLRFMSSG